MAGITRYSSFDTSGEPDQDANSALIELDKSLRSGKIGEQCEAIVRFPRLFEKYPFPILINSSFLKIADTFRTGSNFLRVWILRVFEQNEKHLDKILNLEEFVRRIFSVMHSNDSVARALALRTLGACAGVIPEREQVHHSIRRSLDSNDTVEVQAAIKAARQFAAKSKKFAVSMCSKVSEMIEDLVIPAYMKLDLITILQHMHHDLSTAVIVRRLCTKLLPKYPATEFVIVTLNSLTQLSRATLVDIPEQVTLLMQYLREDPRWVIQAECLKSLKLLAKEGAHLWPQGSIDEVAQVALNSDRTIVHSLSLGVIQVLVQSSVVCHNFMHVNSSLRQLSRKYMNSSSLTIRAQCVEIDTKIACYSYSEKLPILEIDALLVNIRAVIEVMVILNTTNRFMNELKLVLKCLVLLCRSHHGHCEHFIDLLGYYLHQNECVEMNLKLCEALGAIGCLKPESLESQIPTIIELIQSNRSNDLRVMLCTILFQATTIFDNSGTEAIEPIIMDVTSTSNQWINYKIARAATRYAHHNIAEKIFANLMLQISSENLYFWFVGLKEMTSAESELLKLNILNISTSKTNLCECLRKAVNHYCRATSVIKAASTPNHTLQFQYEYIELRMTFLDCLLQLIYNCNSFCLVPPPAIANTNSRNRDNLLHAVQQLKKSLNSFRACADAYGRLYQTAFDADGSTLENIQNLQNVCNIMVQSIERVCCAKNIGSMTTDESLRTSFPLSNSLETNILNRLCVEIAEKSDELLKEDKTLTHKKIDILLQQVVIITNTSLFLPRYFYQTLQSTNVKLSITPQPRIPGDPITVTHASQLAVKVEGVIQHGSTPGLFRSVSEIIITVTSQQQPRPGHEYLPNQDIQTLTQRTKPHRDFFSAQFLLGFTQGGQYTLTVDACLVDENGLEWRAPPKSTFSVKVFDEPKQTSVA